MGQIQKALSGAVTNVALSIAGAKKALSSDDKDTGIDAKMALRARKIAQQKIKTIYANKDISEKAKTRRMGKVIDEYNKTLGGKK